MTKPIIAIVGRTNVGKSTLLNRLAGKRLAVIADLPGTTRDRVFAPISWQGQELTIIDTGGWQPEALTNLEQEVIHQSMAAIAQADVIIFLVDARDGVIATDEEMAHMLHAANKPVVLAVNKIDSDKQADQIADFYYLGIGSPIAISAYHNRGISKLMDAVLSCLTPSAPSLVEPEMAKIAIVGRPNVGKSTLLNALLGSKRAIVHETPGTTRDAIDAVVHWKDRKIMLIDTAGIKRRGHVAAGVDYYSLLRSIQAINRCDVALLLIDAGEFVTNQDLHVAGYIIEARKGIMLVINKWDLVPLVRRQEFKKQLERRLKFMPYVPVLFGSAALGRGIDNILPQAWQVWQERQQKLTKSAVDAVVKEAVNNHPPPRIGTKQLHISQAYQDESNPSTFILRVNDPHLVHFSYQRYLENKLHHNFGFRGVPLQLVFTRAAPKGNKKMEVVGA